MKPFNPTHEDIDSALASSSKYCAFVIKFLIKNRSSILQKLGNDYYFDYPSYGCLPKRISNKLCGDFVDTIQSVWASYLFGDLKQFEKELKDEIKEYQIVKIQKEYLPKIKVKK